MPYQERKADEGMKYLISIEGQMIEMPEEVAGNDEQLKSALTPFFPGAANAKINRGEEKDGTVTIQVIKQAGTKGYLLPVDFLEKAPEGVNTVVQLHRELATAGILSQSPEELLKLDGKINKAMEAGRKEDHSIAQTLDSLAEAPADPAADTIEGF